MTSRNAVSLLTVGVVLAGSLFLCGCDANGGEAQPVEQDDAPAVVVEKEAEETFGVHTPCGDLVFPAEWEGIVGTSVAETDGGCEVTFSTSVSNHDYRLFVVTIGGDGDAVGSITGPDGNDRNVSIEMLDLGDISSLSEDQQNQLYAMQEGVNTIIEGLA